MRDKEYYKKAMRKSRAKNKNGFHQVYLIVKQNYVGVTNSIKDRMMQHRYKHGWSCDDVIVLFQYKERNEALKMESFCHSLGYDGSTMSARKKKINQK